MKLNDLKPLLEQVRLNNAAAASMLISELLQNEEKPAWRRELRRLQGFLQTGIPVYSIFRVDGNSKLPFVAFSALPGAGFCPGAGECINFCYSFKSWRYPAALCRQIQNTMLLNTERGRREIVDALAAISKLRRFRNQETIDLRLYVDGDFRHLNDLCFWMETLATPVGQRFKAYGYSKSFEVFLEYAKHFEFPDNYQLNLSGGHKYGNAFVERMKLLSCARGEFVAVAMPYKVNSKMHGTSDHNRALRQQHGKAAFTCPGKCGECTPKGHACGRPEFKNVDIIIAVH